MTCTATDASGNSELGHVPRDRPVRGSPRGASAIWLEPVGGGESTFEANRGRTIPIKVRLFVDGVERTSGDAALR